MSKYRRILVAIDLEQDTKHIIDGALAAASTGAVLKIVHVVLPLSQAFYANGLGLVQPMVDLNKLEKDIVDKATAQLKSIALRRKTALTLNTEVLTGDIVDTIVEEAESYKAQLIVVGSHATSGIKLLIGSTANGVLHHAPCDTLMVRI